MAVMHEDLGDINTAIGEYGKALRIDPGNTLISSSLDASYIKDGQRGRAIDELKLLIKLEPEAIEPHVVLSLLYSAQGKPELAASEFKVALDNVSRLGPRNLDIYRKLGALYLEQGNLDAAEKTFRLILGMAPQDAEANFNLGLVYQGLKNTQAVIAQMKKAIGLKPDYAQALNYLGYLYIEEGIDLDGAGAMVKKARELDPDNGAYADSLGWFYFKKCKYRRALKELEHASRLLEDPLIRDHLGDAYFKLNDIEKARLNWQKSLDMEPAREETRAKLLNTKSHL